MNFSENFGFEAVKYLLFSYTEYCTPTGNDHCMILIKWMT